MEGWNLTVLTYVILCDGQAFLILCVCYPARGSIIVVIMIVSHDS